MSNLIEPDPELEADLERISRAPIKELRERWRATFRGEPPPAFGPDLLRRSIAYRLQEKRYGGLSVPVQRQLNSLVKAFAKRPDGHIQMPKRIKSGSVLVRLWKGKSYLVMTLDDGFAFEGRNYDSLSVIAREITGTRWNGPAFFGLRGAGTQETVPEPLPRRGRPPKSSDEARHDR
jgi:hypothetical protein